MKFISQLDIRSRKELEKMMKTSKTYRNRIRAHAILLSYKKYSIDAMADIFEVHRDTISRWLDSWHEHGVSGLKDAPKTGRPRVRMNGDNISENSFHLRSNEYELVAKQQ